MIASLVMYARPELDRPLARYWAAIRRRLTEAGIAAPETLSQEVEESSVWLRPDLVLSQTCGMPYRLGLHDRVTLIGTPDYGLEGCPPGHYRSALVVRQDDQRTRLAEFRHGTFAYNARHSQSGYAAAFFHVQQLGFWFDRLHQAGAHVASAKAVAEGRADIAAIDAVTWRLIERHDPAAASLRVLDWTEPTPGLPYIAARGADQPAMFQAIRAAIKDLAPEDASTLGLRDLVYIPPDAYLAVPNP
jgi:hypothetical protein